MGGMRDTRCEQWIEKRRVEKGVKRDWIEDKLRVEASLCGGRWSGDNCYWGELEA